MEMTQNEFIKLAKASAEIDDPSNGYGVTCEAMCKIEDDIEKNIDYLMYLNIRSYYKVPEPDKVFTNADALPCQEVHKWIEEILKKHIQLI